jgi:4-methyl-5(b-hydroxyethyl)-thiazole monophosphate biosynthesis
VYSIPVHDNSANDVEVGKEGLHIHHRPVEVVDEITPRVLIPIADGSEEIEVVTVADVLTRAGCQVTIASVTGKHEVKLSRGIRILADALIEESPVKNAGWDAVVVPGGMLGTQTLSDSIILIDLLKHQQSKRRTIGAICAAPGLVLGKHGLLEGKIATGYPSERFISMIPTYSSESVVVDGHIITSRGPGTAMAFALALSEALFDIHKVTSLKKELVYENKGLPEF